MADSISDLPSQTFAPGEVIFRQGDSPTGEAYLVHEGSVEVRRTVDGEDRVLRTLAKGDLLGEVALFREAPHSATAVALEPTTLLVIPPIDWRTWSRPIRAWPSPSSASSRAWRRAMRTIAAARAVADRFESDR